MIRVALCSKSFIASKKQLVAGSSCTVHEAWLEWKVVRDDPRIKKIKALALKAAMPGERAAALAAIERVERSDRPVERRPAAGGRRRRGPHGRNCGPDQSLWRVVQSRLTFEIVLTGGLDQLGAEPA